MVEKVIYVLAQSYRGQRANIVQFYGGRTRVSRMDLLSFIKLLDEELIQDPNVQEVAPENLLHPRLVPTVYYTQHFPECITDEGDN